ncbi:MAG: hypothetical protein DDT20_01103 [Firmicutes bacterium]|nr:hypothetical protein [Bacillota bacterium]
MNRLCLLSSTTTTPNKSALHAAKWVHAYSGHLVIKRYNKKYGVSLLDCVKELTMLGRPDAPEDLRKYKKWKEERRKAKRARQERAGEQKEVQACFGEHDWVAHAWGYVPLEQSTDELSAADDYTDWPPRKKRAVRTLRELSYVKWVKATTPRVLDVGDEDLPF